MHSGQTESGAFGVVFRDRAKRAVASGAAGPRDELGDAIDLVVVFGMSEHLHLAPEVVQKRRGGGEQELGLFEPNGLRGQSHFL